MTISRRTLLCGSLLTAVAAACTKPRSPTEETSMMTTTTDPLPQLASARTGDEAFDDLPGWDFEPLYVDVDSLRVHYVDEGPSDGHQVVLLHGMPTWSYLWRTTIPPLVSAGFRVIAPDLVGFGRSDKPTEGSAYSLERHVHWLRSTLDAIGVSGATVVLNDWGGLVGLRVAAEADAQLFQRLFIMDTSLNDGTDDLDEQYLQGFRFWLRMWAETPFEQLSPGAVIASQTPALDPEVIAAYDAPFTSEKHVAGLRVNDQLYPLGPEDAGSAQNAAARRRLREWPHPTCLCFSGASERFHPGQRALFRSLLPAELLWRDLSMEGTGHFVAEEHGHELADLVSGFINGTT